MTPAIQQSVEFSASPRELYDLYMDSKKHSAVTGAKASLSRKPGSAFTAFGGSLRGKTWLAVPGKMIVQSWRSTHWSKTDPDSILVITFTPTRAGARVDLVHVNVPAHDHQGVTKGWHHYYWEPWKAHLAALAAPRKKPPVRARP